VLDARRRWEACQFSAITAEYYVIGDVFVKKIDGLEHRKEEEDVTTKFSHLGRTDITYESWSHVNRGSVLQAVRPKINGERFVKIRIGSKWYFKGFRQIEVPESCPAELIEYYAGEWYILYPYIKQERIVLAKEGDVPFDLVLHPHPWQTPVAFHTQRERYESHKFDGVMLLIGTQEFRAKWDPTVEVELNGHTWEVALHKDELIPVRPRTNKIVTGIQAARTKIRSRLRGRFVVQQLPVTKTDRSELSHIEETMNNAVFKEHRQGSKCVFITRKGLFLFIREKGKPLDFIGGQLERFETPLQALVREVEEETNYRMTADQFLSMGSTQQEADNVVWTSHVFLAEAPVGMEQHSLVEAYDIQDFGKFVSSAEGRPRAVWVTRHLEFLHTLSFPEEMRGILRVIFDMQYRPNVLRMSESIANLIESRYISAMAKRRWGTQNLRTYCQENHYPFTTRLLELVMQRVGSLVLTPETTGMILPIIFEGVKKTRAQVRHAFRDRGNLMPGKELDKIIDEAIERGEIGVEKNFLYWKT